MQDYGSTSDELNALTVVPLYKQLAERIEKEIYAAVWTVGMRIPSEMELSEKYGVSRITVRSAINELTEEGLLVKIQGKGTFVTSNKRKKQLTMNVRSFDEFCRQNNIMPRRKLLNICTEAANEDDIKQFNLSPGDKIIHIVRVLIADDRPLILADDRICERFSGIKGKDIEKTSLNSLMIESGQIKNLVSLSRTIEVYTASNFESEQLLVCQGAPLLLVRDIAGDENGIPVRHTKEFIVGESVRLSGGNM